MKTYGIWYLSSISYKLMWRQRIWLLLGSMMRPSMGLSRSSFKTFSSLERLLQVFFKIML